MSVTTPTTAAGTTRTYPSLRAAWVPLAALCLAFFVEMVDNTLLTIALPTIGRDLGSGTTALQWVTGAYSLTFGGLLLTAGSAADRLGRRRVLLVGLVSFGLISLSVVWVHTAGEPDRRPGRARPVRRRDGADHQLARLPAVRGRGAAHARHDRDDRRRHVRFRARPAARRHRPGPRALGVAARRQRPHRAARSSRGPARRAGRPPRGPHRRRPRPARRGAQHRLHGRGLLRGDQRRAARLAVARHRRLRAAGRPRRRRVRAARAAHRVADARPAAVLRRHRARRRHRAGGHLDRHGERHVRADPALPVRLRLEPRGRRPGQPAADRHDGPRRPGVDGARQPPRAPRRLPDRRRPARRVAARPVVGVSHGYVAVAACMVVMTLGLRTVMTICAVALVGAVPENRTSLAAAMNDTAQEVGTSIGTAVVGTLIAVLVTTTLPAGRWSAALVASFFHGERITYAVLAVVVGAVAALGARSLSDSRSTEDAH
nr:MFS transporter [Angustibacter aerolatus]